jgi:putative SOS response-associated peptidase YedK
MEAMLRDVVREFGVDSKQARELQANWNIKPTEDLYVITQDEISVASWGMIAPWSKSTSDAQKSQSKAINARSETVHEKPTFKNALQRSRCLVPATGYYEWATELGDYKPRQPIYVSNNDGNLLAFSGIYDRWVSPEGESRESFSIITRDAIGDLAKFHSRMPMFLPRERWSAWLDPSLKEIGRIRDLFENSQPDANLRFWPVADLVNSIRNNGPELIAPIEVIRETLF